MKYKRLLSYTVRIYREKEYVVVRYATYLCTKKSFRRIFASSRAAHLAELNQEICVTLRGAHLESCSTSGIESRTVVDTDLRPS